MQEHLNRERWHVDGQFPFYRLDQLYDYVIAAVGSALSAQANGKRWAEVDDALNRLPHDASATHARLIKTIGLLNLLGDHRSLRASKDILVYALGDGEHSRDAIEVALDNLEQWGIVVYRSFRDSYGLWEGSDVDLDDRFERGSAQLDRSVSVAALLERGAYLRLHYSQATSTSDGHSALPVTSSICPTYQRSRSCLGAADGLLVYVLPDGVRQADVVAAIQAFGRSLAPIQHAQMLFVVPHHLSGLREALETLQTWEWVAANTPSSRAIVWLAANRCTAQ